MPGTLCLQCIIATALILFSTLAFPVCFDGGVYVPRAPSTEHVKSSTEQEQVRFDINSQTYLSVSECGWAERKPTKDPIGICFTIQVETGRTFKFTSSFLSIDKTEGDGTPQTKTTFTVELPNEEIKGAAASDPYLSDPNAPFKPAVKIIRFFMKPLIPRRHDFQETFRHAKLPENLFDAFTLKLPPAQIDGTAYNIPEIYFKFSSEKMCWFTP